MLAADSRRLIPGLCATGSGHIDTRGACATSGCGPNQDLEEGRPPTVVPGHPCCPRQPTPDAQLPSSASGPPCSPPVPSPSGSPSPPPWSSDSGVSVGSASSVGVGRSVGCGVRSGLGVRVGPGRLVGPGVELTLVAPSGAAVGRAARAGRVVGCGACSVRSAAGGVRSGLVDFMASEGAGIETRLVSGDSSGAISVRPG